MLYQVPFAGTVSMLHSDIRHRLECAVAERIFPGCVFGVVNAEGEREVVCVGGYTYENDFAMFPEAVFDIASLTKVIPTACAALTLVDRGDLRLDSPVAAILTNLVHSRADRVTLHHLLTHTLDYRMPLSSLRDEKPRDLLDAVLREELSSEPGECFNYANATSILLGLVVESVYGKTLDLCANELFFSRLDMNHTTFHPQLYRSRVVVPTENDPWRGEIIVGEVHDESAWVLQQIMIPGSAGLFSTVPDLLTFLEMLLNKGIFRSRRYFSESIIREMGTNQIPHLDDCTGLGWEMNQPRFMGKNSAQLIGKTGYTGCSLHLDLQRGVGCVLLSNRTWPQRTVTADAINEIRRDIADMVFSAG